ncbi:MAG: KEOPS complex N(6)-L-threonylcarbamoyladenine synthase Kae1 [Nitrososphaeraceae archaeon]
MLKKVNGKNQFICLGIESTAHTFGCSLVKLTRSLNRKKILSDRKKTYTAPIGQGIHPREASRHHMQNASEILKKTLQDARIKHNNIDLIAYSAGPGLGPCLRVGAVVARTLSGYYNIPLIAVNHAIGHIELGIYLTKCKNPLVLLVSGGHTMILAFSNKKWRVFGETLDITIGQLLDQFGRSIGLSSPCGNKIEELASKSNKFHYLPYVVKGNDVSFSGILTASKLSVNRGIDKFDICFSLQETAFAMITEVVERALSFTGKKEILIVGGVAANKRLSSMLHIAAKRQKSKFFVCPIEYAGDNGSQIALTGISEYISTNKTTKIEQSFVKQSWRLDTVEVKWR